MAATESAAANAARYSSASRSSQLVPRCLSRLVPPASARRCRSDAAVFDPPFDGLHKPLRITYQPEMIQVAGLVARGGRKAGRMDVAVVARAKWG